MSDSANTLFEKKDASFVCLNCGYAVPPLGYSSRNHWSALSLARCTSTSCPGDGCERLPGPDGARSP